MIEAPAILTPRIVVLKVGDLVRAASFVFNKKLADVFLDLGLVAFGCSHRR